MDDSGIIELYEARDESAIGETEKKYGPYYRVIAMNILRDDGEAGECLNDVYLTLWNSIPPEKPDNLAVYGGKIVRNKALDLLRHRKAQKRGSGNISDAVDELEDCLPASVSENMTDPMLIRDTLNKFLQGLKSQQRVIFVDRYWFYMPVEEIAEKLGIGESKVKTTLMRQRKELRKMLEREGINV